MKRVFRHIFGVIFYLSFIHVISAATAATIHSVAGTVRYEDGSTPPAITFSAYIKTRPADVITQNDVGAGYEDGIYYLQCGNFSSWQIGEILKVDFDDGRGHTTSGEVTLTGASVDTLNITLYYHQYSVTFQTSPDSLDLLIDGQPHTSPHTFLWQEDTEHTIHVDSVQSGGTGIRHRYVGWEHTSRRSHTLTVTASATYTANFITQYELTTRIEPDTSGTLLITPEKSWYDANETVTVEAISDLSTPYRFANWTGDRSGTDNPVVITMNGPVNITANYDMPDYALNLTIDPPGGGSVNVFPVKQEYTFGETVHLFPTASEGFEFTGWTGDTLTTGDLALVMNRDWNVSANFATLTQGVPVTIITHPAGLPFYADQQLFTAPHTFTWQAQTWHEIRVDTLIYLSNTRYHFTAWEEDTSVTEIHIQTAEADTFKAFFDPQFQLNITKIPDLGGNVYIYPEQLWYDAGDEVRLEAEANSGAGYAFSAWSGALTGYQNPVTMTINASSQVAANFTYGHYALTTNVEPAGKGAIQRLPDQASFASGDTVYLIAHPDTAWRFDSWTGDAQSTNEILMLIMDQSKNVTGKFRHQSDTTALSNNTAHKPKQVHLTPNYPNPFNPSTTLRFSLPKKELVDISIYNINGQHITTLLHETRDAGTYHMVWHTGDRDGKPLNSGIYLIVLTTSRTRHVQRALLLK